MKCRVCGEKLIEAFSLGKLYTSNFIPKEHQSEDYSKSDLTMMYCFDCKLGQLKKTVDPDKLYRKYYYRSNINQTMRFALLDVVKGAQKSIEWNRGDVLLDVGSNDGTLLNFSSRALVKVGIDPSDVAKESANQIDFFSNNYFSHQIYKECLGEYYKPAKIITAIAMFYDLANPIKFLEEVYQSLDKNGLLILQLSYTPLMLNQLELGNIATEHIMYHTLTSLDRVLCEAGFGIMDVELNDVNGGSIRVYAMKLNSDSSKFRSPQKRDVADLRVESLLVYEEDFDLYKYESFWDDVNELKNKVINFVKDKKTQGKRVVGLGASTKANTFLQFWGLTHQDLDYIVDRNPLKKGLKTIGSEIPIVNEEYFRADSPEYALLLVWHFQEEIIKRERGYLQQGGKLAIPCPKFRVVSNE